jgi:hypothetical protein
MGRSCLAAELEVVARYLLKRVVGLPDHLQLFMKILPEFVLLLRAAVAIKTPLIPKRELHLNLPGGKVVA